MARLTPKSSFMLQQYIKGLVADEVRKQTRSGKIPSTFGDVALTSLEVSEQDMQQGSGVAMEAKLRKEAIEVLKGNRVEQDRDAQRAEQIRILKGGK